MASFERVLFNSTIFIKLLDPLLVLGMSIRLLQQVGRVVIAPYALQALKNLQIFLRYLVQLNSSLSLIK